MNGRHYRHLFSEFLALNGCKGGTIVNEFIGGIFWLENSTVEEEPHSFWLPDGGVLLQ